MIKRGKRKMTKRKIKRMKKWRREKFCCLTTQLFEPPALTPIPSHQSGEKQLVEVRRRK